MLQETQQDPANYDATFVGDTQFGVGAPPRIVLDGTGDAAVTPAIGATPGYGATDHEHTLCVRVKPGGGQVDTYVFDRSNNSSDIILGYVADQFEYFVEGAKWSGPNDPRQGTQIGATIDVWQTICY